MADNGSTRRSAPDPRLLVVAFVLVAVGVRVAFWVVTDRVWEDALITITHARNAVAGLGLTHHAGEPLTHGFTSALSVLVPLVGETATPGGGIVALRLVSLVAAGVTIVLAGRILGRLGIGRWPTAFALAYLAVNQNHVFYGMAGMETQLGVAVLLWGVDRLQAGAPGSTGVSLGAPFGLALLARPDFALWVAAAGLELLTRSRRLAVRAGAAALAVIGPWLIVTTLLYGSPAPQTIIAKSAVFASPPLTDPGALVAWLGAALEARTLTLLLTFAPFYEDWLVVAAPMPVGLALAVSIGVWVLAVAGARRAWRRHGWRAVVLFAAVFTLYRLLLLPGTYFDWYLPPHTAVLVLLAAIGLDGLRPLPRFDPRPVLAAVLAIAFAVHIPWSFGIERRIQADIEHAVRREVGLAIAELVAPGETLATESAGYYGYYGDALMLDYPGLTSRRALAAVRALPPERRGILDVLDALQADWMALRTGEWLGLQKVFPETAARYEVVRRFTAPAGSVTIDAQGRQRIGFGGLVKDASSAEILLLRRR